MKTYYTIGICKKDERKIDNKHQSKGAVKHEVN